MWTSWLHAGSCRAVADDSVLVLRGSEGGRPVSDPDATCSVCHRLVIKVSPQAGYLSLEPGSRSWLWFLPPLYGYREQLRREK